ncbi:hypothetical protein ACJMK2_024397 [Sinanodonta woodiana]|uniref:Uncharacterized protein n=1 Tax=Sinanodonta woodiana TaxID=1069815 RepID=A0ABD3T790_SINWO
MKTTIVCLLVVLLLSAQPAKAWLYVIAGAAATALMAPFAIPAGVATIGFTAVGIMKGSIAAGMMASYGGLVSSGSVVAVMQSIGAAGLGAGGIAVAGSGGAAAGAIYENLKDD